MKTFYMNPKEIKIKEALGRVRKDMGNLQELADSIKKLGQIVPVVVNEKNELVDGGRRVGACIILNKEIFCVLKENLNDLEMKTLELEANIRRKAFNPIEELEGIKFLHEMKSRDHAEWDNENTGDLLGMEESTVSRKLQLAKAVEAFPELKKLKNEKEITKAVKQIAKVTARAKAVKEYDESGEENKAYNIQVKDMVNSCKETPDNSIHLLLTDPPYGIEIDKNMEAMKLPGNFTYKDGYADAVWLYHTLAKESFRFVKENGHAIVFFGPEFYEIVKSLFVLAGWQTNHRPIIWIKHASGQCNQPTMWPSACYEMAMYFRKNLSKLVIEGKPDWVQFNPVPPQQKVHPSEKPIELLRELIQRVALPGDTMFDPFMGSGSAMEAAVLEKLIPKGSDIAQECYDMTMDRLNNLKEI